MPAVPRYDEPRVTPSGPNDARFSTPDTSAFVENGRELQRFGATLEAAGEQFGKGVEQAQEQANDLRVIDAENKAREAAIKLTVDQDEGYANIKGGDVMDVNGRPLAEDYRARYQASLDEISAGLSNDAQRQAFARSAAVLGQGFYGKAREYEAGQYADYQQSVVKGSADLAGQEIALNYRDPEFIDRRLGSLDVAVAKLARLNGVSGNQTEALQNTARSTAISGAIGAALDADDIPTAQNLFDRYRDKMLAPDIGKIETVLQRETVGQTALAIGDAVFNTIPGTGAEQPQFEKVFSALIDRESGGNGNAVSPKGALGSTQMLPATAQEMARKLGVVWRPELIRSKSADALAYQAQLGRAYLQEGLQKYGGDFYKALCYYHGGPDEKQWGPKTRAYAQAVLAKCGVRDTGTSPVAAPAASLEDAIQAGRRMLPEGASYAQTKAVEEEITRRWSVRQQSANAAEEQTVSSAMTALLGNGGDVSRIPAGVRNAIPGDKWGGVLGFARTVQEFGKQRDSVHDDAMYNFAITHPEVIRDSSDSNFLAKYAGHPKFEEIAQYRAQLQGKKPVGDGKAPGSLNYGTINRVVDSRLQSAGIDPKDNGQEGHVGAVRRVINGAIAGEQRRIGRQLTDAETESFVDKQFARPGVINTSFFGTKTPIPLFAVDVDHIPPADRKMIDDALDRAGQPKTDANRLALYYAGRMR